MRRIADICLRVSILLLVSITLYWFVWARSLPLR